MYFPQGYNWKSSKSFLSFSVLDSQTLILDPWILDSWKFWGFENWFETVNLHVLLTDTVHVNLILVSTCTHILGREDNCENIQPDIMKCRPISKKSKSQVFLCPSLSLCFRSQWVFITMAAAFLSVFFSFSSHLKHYTAFSNLAHTIAYGPHTWTFVYCF